MRADNIEIPKGSAWLVYHYPTARNGKKGVAAWAYVYDAAKGLTPYEAWQQSNLLCNPAFAEVTTVMLAPFPLSASTQTEIRRKIAPFSRGAKLP